MQTESLVQQILQYHDEVVKSPQTIADIAKKQIESAWLCGSCLRKAKDECPSNKWGKWCTENLPRLSSSTIQRYILLCKQSDLTECLAKYKTLNQAYIGEGITSGPQKRVTVKATPGSGSGRNGRHVNSEKLKLSLRGGGAIDINKLPKRMQDQIREQAKTAPLLSDAVAVATNYRGESVSVASNRLETAKRLIGELADVLEQDKGPSHENREIYKAMSRLAVWHREFRMLSDNMYQGREGEGSICDRDKGQPVDTTKKVESNILAEVSESPVDIPPNPQPEEALAA